MNVLAASDRLNYAPTSPADLARPLDFLVTEHERYRVCCDTLLRLADDPTVDSAPHTAASILKYITEALPQHVADEEDGLYPLLWRACYPNDSVGRVLERLCGNHQDDIECSRTLIGPLRAIAAGGKATDRFSHHARSLAARQRGHVWLENVVILRLAYKRLSGDDLGELWRGMAERRGLFPLH